MKSFVGIVWNSIGGATEEDPNFVGGGIEISQEYLSDELEEEKYKNKNKESPTMHGDSSEAEIKINGGVLAQEEV